MSKVLSFDTSNYTTSACVFDTEYGVLWENKIMLPVTTGQCGIRQNEAVFLHTRNLKTLFSGIPKYNFDYVAASAYPTESQGSYMPCFTVGVSIASALSNLLGIPFYSCSHQKNHIAAAIYSCEKKDILTDDFFAYHISGGTTDIMICTPSKNVFDVSKIGGTADISCGQLIDRIGVKCGFSFPCGKSVEMHSRGELSNDITIKNKDRMYNFSGFQNRLEDMLYSGQPQQEICRYALSVVYSFLYQSIDTIRSIIGKDLPVLLSGGVSSNRIVRNQLSANVKNVYFANPEYSTDNALGTAYMCAMERGLLNG